MRIIFINSNASVASYNDVCDRMKEAMEKLGHTCIIVRIQDVLEKSTVVLKTVNSKLYAFKRSGKIHIEKTSVSRIKLNKIGRFDKLFFPQLFVTSAVEGLNEFWASVADEVYFMGDLEGTTKRWNEEVKAIANSWKVYASSQFSYENITNLGVKVKGVFERAIDFEKFRKLDPKQIQHNKQKYGEFVLAWCGYEQAVHHRKGADHLIHAYQLAEKEGKIDRMPTLVLVTNKPRQEVEEEEHTKIPNKIIVENLFGRLSKEAQINLYASAKYFVAPSHAEGFGLLPLESQATGTPSIYVDSRAQNEHAVGYKVAVNDIEWHKTKWDLIYKYFLYDEKELMDTILYAWENRDTDYYKELSEKSVEVASRYALDNYLRLEKL